MESLKGVAPRITARSGCARLHVLSAAARAISKKRGPRRHNSRVTALQLARPSGGQPSAGATRAEPPPADAAAWGWLVAREYKADVAAQYERADAEQGYRFYLEFSGLGTHREARRAFSVPGVAIGAP